MDCPFPHFASEVGDFVSWKVLFSAYVKREVSWGEGKGEERLHFFLLAFPFPRFLESSGSPPAEASTW